MNLSGIYRVLINSRRSVVNHAPPAQLSCNWNPKAQRLDSMAFQRVNHWVGIEWVD